MPRLILHIGTMKTGSTALQHVLSDQREALRQDGILYPTSQPIEGRDWPKHKALQVALVQGGDLLTEVWGNITREIDESGAHTVILSNETFSLPGPYNRGGLRDLLKGFSDIETVVFFRRQDQFYESRWNQDVKMIGGTCDETIEEFVRFRLTPKRDPLGRWAQLVEEFGAFSTVRAASYDDVQKYGLRPVFERLTGIDIGQDPITRNEARPMEAAAAIVHLRKMGLPVNRLAIFEAFKDAPRTTALGRKLRLEILKHFKSDRAALKKATGITFDPTLPDEPEEPLNAPTHEGLFRALATLTDPATRDPQ